MMDAVSAAEPDEPDAVGDVSFGPLWATDELELGSGIPIDPHLANVKSDLTGFGLVLAASMGICVSLNIQKLVHMRNVNAVTGRPEVSFVTLPFWWAGVILNAVSELLNLAALGYAPATLVTPLGCLTVVFNAIASAVLLREPFLRRDLLGIALIFVGVLCVVWSQVRRTPARDRSHAHPS